MTSSKEKILIITSNPQLDYLLDRVLKSGGYTVTLCPEREIGARHAGEKSA